MKSRIYLLVLLLLPTLLIASCGGGGGGGTSQPPAPVAPPPPPPVEHTVTVTQAPENAVAYLNTPATDTVTWTFSSTGSATAQERYTLESDPEGIQFGSPTPQNLVTHGTSTTTDLTYQCTEVGMVEFRITLTIVSSGTQETFDWAIDCQLAPDDQIELVVKFYQGVLLGIMDARQSPDGWSVFPREHTWPDFSFTRDHTLSTNRQTIIEVDLARSYAVNTDISLDFPNLTEGQTADRIMLETVQEIVGEGAEQTEVFIRRVAYDVSAFGISNPNTFEITIAPIDVLPQITSDNNVIQVDMSDFQRDELPELKLLIVPIRWEKGAPEDVEGFIDSALVALRDFMPVVDTAVRFTDEIDLSGREDRSINYVLRQISAVRTEQGEPGEYAHGLFVGGTVDGVPFTGEGIGVAGAATLSGRDAFSCGQSRCERTVAHEIGHNLSLGHPGESSLALYPDGGIGVENGWLLSERKRMIPAESENIMKRQGVFYLDDFITQQYYGKAKRHYIAANPVVSASRPPQVAVDFERAEGRSFVLVGERRGRADWSVAHESVVKREAFPQDNSAQEHVLRLVHTNSGTEIYRTALPVYEVVHGDPDIRSWSARIPAYSGAGLSVEVLDRDRRVVFSHDLGRVEL